MTDVPHLAWPLRLSGSSFAVVEQDSIDEIQQNVAVICDTPLGTYLHQPEFGIPDPTFTQLPVDTDGIVDAVADLEERATVTVDDQVDDRLIAQGTDRVTVRVGLVQAG